MKRSILILLLIALFLPALVFASRGIEVKAKLESASGKTIGTYRALIIGINDYRDEAIPDLDTAVNDAREVSELLQKEYGFSDVRLLLNQEANSTNIIGEMERLAAESNENDSILYLLRRSWSAEQCHQERLLDTGQCSYQRPLQSYF